MSAPAELLPIRLEPNDKLTIHGVEYVPDSYDCDHHCLRRLDMPDVYQEFRHDDLHRIWDEHVDFQPGFFSKAAGRKRAARRSPRDFPLRDQQMIAWRMDWCDAFLIAEKAGETTRSHASMNKFIEANGTRITRSLGEAIEGRRVRCDRPTTAFHPPSPSALREWVRKYTIADRDPAVLRDRRGRSGNRSERLHDDVRATLVRVAENYADERRLTIKQVYDLLRDEIMDLNASRTDSGEDYLQIPGIGALKSEIQRLDPYKTMAVREGMAKARNKYDPIRHGHRITRPLERVEMDEWMVSLQTVMQRAGLWSKLTAEQKAQAETIRVWVAIIMDCATRTVLGVHLLDGSPTSADALATIRLAVSDKSEIAKAAGCQSTWPFGGLFDVLATDTGPSYNALETRWACGNLGAEILFPQAGIPQMRGRIERMFSTLHKEFISLYHGRTFENVVKKGDYKAEEMAVMDREELYMLLVRFIVDVYHNKPHKSLGGETPRDCWNRLGKTHHIRKYASADQIGSVFGLTLERKLRREGLEVFGLFYSHDDLHRARQRRNLEKVKIRVDQTDISRIWVFLDEKWLRVEAVRKDLDGVTLESWVKNRAEDRKRFSAQAEEMQPIVDAAYRNLRDFAISAERRAGLFPLTYSHARVSALAESLTKYERADDDEAEGDIFEPDQADDDIPSSPVHETQDNSNGPSVRPSNVDDSDDFLED